ncbi:enoyl-CoA hydratase/isomerase family protein [Taibaiella chishuiensis]|uniref:Methylglutaconyl-CoA hydratase n=1 Tax=Taibaiella chishuiensis TaxID=1434707 RepID=A0A2P8DBI5_9BACT|nr:enoyl-CoA hydratase/isomerase family protein [Taibaiella chishuiensis]PSK94588.1 methylglutaconyl-CoA hydratase [Taibaiella chishuiensis]
MTTKHPEGYVHTSIENGIGKIEFYHPSSNSLPGAILTDLAHAINDVGTDERAKVIVLQSAGERSFCAGASFDELIAISNEVEGHKFFSGFALVINAMRKCHKFIIARVQGKAVGGGVGIISAADYAIAVDTASIKLSELAVGIGPFVVGPAVERKIGVSAFSQLAIDATEWRSADWARKRGLYSEIHTDIASTDEAVSVLANKLAHANPEAMTQLKKVFWEGTENWDELLTKRAAISGKLVLSEFTRNAIHSFKKKS